MEKGLFITIEGPDGSGKSTQIENIRKFFAKKGTEILLTREPGGTPIGERIRDIILDNNCKEMCDVTEAMLYAAARAQHVRQIIMPALKEGRVVVCDRFVDSSLAYQGYGRDLGSTVWDINKIAIGDCIPDVTFLMKVDPKVGKHRIEEGRATEDRLEQEADSFHVKVYEGYLELEKLNPERIVGIDASRSIAEIRDDIYKKLEELLDEGSEF